MKKVVYLNFHQTVFFSLEQIRTSSKLKTDLCLIIFGLLVSLYMTVNRWMQKPAFLAHLMGIYELL